MLCRLCASLVSLLLLLPAAAAAADLTVDTRSNCVIEAMINGQPVRLRVDPEGAGYIVLNPEAAARIGLHPSLLRVQTRVGPVRISGSSREASVTIGGVAGNRRLLWFDRPAIAGADGVIGPADLPYDRVTFAIATPRAGEADLDIPMEFSRGYGLYVPLSVGGYDFRVRLSLMKPFSLASAAAGAVLAEAYGGSWAGPPADQAIDFEIVRPARPMAFARPIGLQGLELRGLRVRTGDNRGDLSLPPEPDADPDEVVVTAASRQHPDFVVHVGMDILSRCSSLVWDNRTRRLSLHCAPA